MVRKKGYDGNLFSDIPVFHRILLHLFESQPRQHRLSMPLYLTQTGIADAVGASQNFISVVLNDMVSQGLVEDCSAHVENHGRKMKVYELTQHGLQDASQVYEGVLKKIARVADGSDILEMTIGECISRYKPAPRVVTIIRETGIRGYYIASPDQGISSKTATDGKLGKSHRKKTNNVLDLEIDNAFSAFEEEMGKKNNE